MLIQVFDLAEDSQIVGDADLMSGPIATDDSGYQTKIQELLLKQQVSEAEIDALREKVALLWLQCASYSIS